MIPEDPPVRLVDELRDIFQQMIKSAIDLKIANLSELCIDGTRVLADASRRKTWTTAVRMQNRRTGAN